MYRLFSKKFYLLQSKKMEQKGITFDHDFYVVVGKQCRTKNLYKLTNTLLLLICFKLVMKSMKLC